MDTKSSSVRDNGLTRRMCAALSEFENAVSPVSDERAAVLIEDAAFLVAFADMLPLSPAADGIRTVAARLRALAGESA